MKAKNLLFSPIARGTALFAFACTVCASAATSSWTSTTGGNWEDLNTASWLDGVVADGSGFTANFTSDITAATTVILSANRTIGDLTFSDNGALGSSWVLGGSSTLTLSGGSTSTITTTTDATISAILAGTNSLTKAGAGRLTLSGANTYSGGTILGGGSVTLSNATGFGTGSISVTANTAVSVGAAFSNNIAVDSGATLSLSGGFINVNGIISGSGNVTATNSIHLRGTNTYTGNTTATGGFLCIDKEASLGATPSTFNAASLTLSGGYLSNYLTGSAFSLSANRGITLATGNTGGFDVGGGALTINGVISGSGGFSKQGSNPLILTAENTYSGPTNVTAGELRSEMGTRASGTYTPFGTSTITVGSGRTLRFQAGSTTNTYTIGNAINLNSATLAYQDGNHILTGNIALTGANTINGVWGDKKLTLSGIVSGSGSLNHTGSSTLTLAGTNTYSGATALSGGILSISSIKNVNDVTGSSLGNVTTVANGTLGFNTGALEYSGTGSTTDRVINLAGTTGGATINQSGTGLLRFSSANTATGIGSKTLTLSGSTAGTGEISGAIVDNSTTGSTSLSSTFVASATTVTLASVDGVTVGASISGTGIASGTTVTAINTGTKVVTLSTATTGASGAAGSSYTVAGVRNITSLAKSGSGTWTLSGSNTYTGNTSITGGKLLVGGSGRLNAGAYAGTIAISSGANLEHGSSTAQALTGVISGAGSLIKNGGTGVLTLSGLSNNTYSGGTTIGNGTVSLGTGGTAANTSTVAALGSGTVNINSNGILRLWIKNDASFTITNNLALNGGRVENEDGTYTLSGTVSLAGANTFETTYSGKNLTFSNTISGAGSLTVIGGGNTTLSGANTYTGATTVDGTRLILANATATSGIALSNNGELRLRNISLSSTQNITGAGNVTKDVSTFGASTINGNNNTYSGSTTVNIDRFTVGSTGVINGTSGIAVQAQWGANFNNLGSVTTAGAITVAGSGNTTGGGLSTDSSFFRNSGTVNAGSMTLNSSASANTTANRGGTYSQTAGSTTLSGTATLAANGGTGAAGTAGNDAAFNLTGGTFSAGTLAVNSGTVTATGGTLNLGSGGITKTGTSATAINLGATTLGATAAWSSSVDMTLTDATTGTTFDTSGGNISLSGALSGVGSKLVKSGTGSLTLSGTSTYSGTTTVSAGTLLVNGTLGNTAVTVSNGATLGGTGIITGSVAFSGDSMLNIADVSDGLDVTGAVTFGSGFGFDNISGWDYQNAALGTYTLLSGGNISLAGMDHVGLENAFTLNNGNIAYFQQGSLQAVIAVPETGSALLGGIGLLLLLRRRR
jgi:autotransporter-associated beta strand protein